MINKSVVDQMLSAHLPGGLIKIWWDLKLPGLGGRTPNEVWEDNPADVVEYVQKYSDPSFS